MHKRSALAAAVQMVCTKPRSTACRITYIIVAREIFHGGFGGAAPPQRIEPRSNWVAHSRYRYCIEGMNQSSIVGWQTTLFRLDFY